MNVKEHRPAHLCVHEWQLHRSAHQKDKRVHLPQAMEEIMELFWPVHLLQAANVWRPSLYLSHDGGAPVLPI